MAKTRRVHASFTAGELEPSLRGRSDTQVYYLGLEDSTNILVVPQGPARQRPGMRVRRSIAGPLAGYQRVRLLDWVFNAGQTYIVQAVSGYAFITDLSDYGTEVVATPFVEEAIPGVAHFQLLDVMLLTHPDVHSIWELARTPTGFTGGQYVMEQWPQYKYHADKKTTLAASGTTGSVTLTAAGGTNNNVFHEDDVGFAWTMAGTSLTITAVASPTSATATVNGTLTSSSATTNWTEAAASLRRGGHRSITHAGDRLVLGGTRDMPFHMWFSRVGQPYDFLEGGTADDDPFSLSLPSADPIVHLIAGSGGIEVYTEGGEGYIPFGPDNPLTISTVAYVPQTGYGSRSVRPVRMDSQTVFAQRSGGSLREFVYNDVEQAYAAVPLTVRAAHLLPDVRSMTAAPGAFGLPVDFLVVANSDGTAACMTSLRSEQVTAWTRWKSRRTIHAVRGVLDRVFAVTTDGEYFWLEEFDPAARFDSQLDIVAGSPTDTWGPITHLIGLEVDVFAEGYWRGRHQIGDDGMLVTDAAYSAIEVGLPIDISVRPMPPDYDGGQLLGRPIRAYKAELSYNHSAGLRLDGYVIPDRPFDDVIETAPQIETNVARVYLPGWQRGKTRAPTITREGPMPFEIVGLAVDYRIGGG